MQNTETIRAVINALDSLSFPVKAIRNGDDNLSIVVGCINALEGCCVDAEAVATEGEDSK